MPEPITHASVSSCCSTDTQTTCCKPEQKNACCGKATEGSCGCSAAAPSADLRPSNDATDMITTARH